MKRSYLTQKNYQLMTKKYGFNESVHGKYYAIPDASPYSKIDENRLQNPKFIFRHALKIITEKNQHLESRCLLLDIGCGNGEFLKYVFDNYPDNNLTGLDLTQEFLDTAKAILKDNTSITLVNSDILNFKGNFDIIFCFGTFQIFPDPTALLNKIITMLNPGGIAIMQGRFIPEACDVILKFRDRSVIDDKDLWRCDFNIHSEKTINEILEINKHKIDWYFDYITIDTEIESKKDSPAVYTYIFRDEDGNLRITLGLKQLIDPSFLIISKKSE